jgi:Flp pilus assembly protein TadG
MLMKVPMQLLNILKAFDHDERGQIAFSFMIFSFAFFALFALALDAGIWYFDHRHAQNEADAAAQAAMLDLPDTGAAFLSAQKWLVNNHNSITASSTTMAEPTNCGVMGSNETKVVFAVESGVTSVRVCIRRTSGGLALFSRLSGTSSVAISATAKAYQKTTYLRYPIVVLDPIEPDALKLTSNVCVKVEGGGIYVDTSAGQTVFINGGTPGNSCTHPDGDGRATIVSDSTHIVGLNGPHGNGNFPSPILTGEPVLPDPYADLPDQLPSVACNSVPNNGAKTLSPGCYSDPVSLGGAQWTLTAAGKYYFKRGLTVTSSLKSDGKEVVLVALCNTGSGQCNGGIPDPIVINGAVDIKGCSTNCPGTDLRHIAIWVDRTASLADGRAPASNSAVSFQGNTATGIQGSIYARNSRVSLRSSGARLDVDLNLSIVAGLVDFSGNAEFGLTWSEVTAPSVITRALID